MILFLTQNQKMFAIKSIRHSLVAQLVMHLPSIETSWDQYLVFSAGGEGLKGYLPVKKMGCYPRHVHVFFRFSEIIKINSTTLRVI